MNAFWDSSAVLALLYREPHSQPAQNAASVTRVVYAWWWMQVETSAALHRRGSSSTQKQNWQQLLDATCWLDVPREKADELCMANATWRLRSADAGHLYAFRALVDVVDELTLVSFDQEMIAVARDQGWKVWGG